LALIKPSIAIFNINSLAVVELESQYEISPQSVSVVADPPDGVYVIPD